MLTEALLPPPLLLLLLTGAEIVRTTDYGLTWAPSDGTVSLDIFLATAVKNESAIIVTGASHNAFSVDGTHFHPSSNLRFAATPSAGVLPTSDLFATPYATESESGVGTSPDGRTWAKHPLTGLDPTYFQARYGSFPSACTWFMSVGAFPVNPQTSTRSGPGVEEAYLPFSKHVRINRQTTRAELLVHDSGVSTSVVQNCSVDPTNCYAAGVTKSTDCGKTWTTLYKNVNSGDNFYPNGIDCSTTDHCVAVFEGDTCRVLMTENSGKTWTEVMHDTDPACSLVSVRMVRVALFWGFLESHLCARGCYRIAHLLGFDMLAPV
jgi:hypothetical protein